MLKPSLQLKLGQQLTMTPQLQQAIRLLQLPALELQAHIRELLESNVMLEADEEADSTANIETLPPPVEAAGPPIPRGAGMTRIDSRNSPIPRASRCRSTSSGSSSLRT